MLPAFNDPFAGGGALPLEAQRLGLESYASDLNPVAVLINKAKIEIPPKFVGQPPVHPIQNDDPPELLHRQWTGMEGLAEDVRFYVRWMRDEAMNRIGELYPKAEVTPDIVKGRPDLKRYQGKQLTVIAWLWARTVRSPNPAFAKLNVPLVSSFLLSTKDGKEAYIEPVIESGSYRFTVKVGKVKANDAPKRGTSAGKRAAFECVMSGAPIPYEYIRSEGQAGRLGARLMAIVAEGDRGRVYLPPTPAMEKAARTELPLWKPDTPMHGKSRVNVSNYGLDVYGDLFSGRQLAALTTFSDLVQEARAVVKRAALATGMRDGDSLADETGFAGASAYADAIAVYLAFVVEKLTESHSTLCTWSSSPKNELIVSTFRRQALAMTWDFAEANPFADSSGSLERTGEAVARVATTALSATSIGHALQLDAASQKVTQDKVVSTDPPYYDNIAYADLSDYFYVWLRRSLRSVYPELFKTVAVPKAEELVATPYRHGSKEQAETFFLEGMTRAMQRLAEQAHPAFPVSIYYAFKQSENDGDEGTTNTGWDTFLAAVIESGFAISGTWPIRTERGSRSTSIGTNALASSIVLICRPRAADSPTVTRRDFAAALKAELPAALADLQRGNIAPVDLAQAAIGPGMAVFTRFAKVLGAEGKPLTVREALALINQTLDEALADQEGDFDADTRWALTWYDQVGFATGEFGVANQLAQSKNTSVSGMVQAGILESKGGKVRLFKPKDLSDDWDPMTDSRLTVWECVHHLIRVLEGEGEAAAAVLAARLGSRAEVARELAYRLYTLCERKKRANEALSYNGLVQSWPEIMRLSKEGAGARAADPQLEL